MVYFPELVIDRINKTQREISLPSAVYSQQSKGATKNKNGNEHKSRALFKSPQKMAFGYVQEAYPLN